MFRQKDDAASDVIAFILILALLISAVAGWMLVIVPGQGLEAENAHNEKVLQEFTELKTGIDQLWLSRMSGYGNSYLISLAPSERTSLSTLMYLAPTLGSGMIKIENGTSLNMTDTKRITYIGLDGNRHWIISEGYNTEINLLRLSFYSDNQYAPNYIITYEGGAVWYSDESGNSYLLVNPFIDKTDYKRFILLAANDSVTSSSILGNLPVTVHYQYSKIYRNTYEDSRIIDEKNSILAINKTREYIELYDPIEITAASESQKDINIASFWENQFKAAATYNETKFRSGSEIQIMYYDFSVSGGV